MFVKGISLAIAVSTAVCVLFASVLIALVLGLVFL